MFHYFGGGGGSAFTGGAGFREVSRGGGGNFGRRRRGASSLTDLFGQLAGSLLVNSATTLATGAIQRAITPKRSALTDVPSVPNLDQTAGVAAADESKSLLKRRGRASTIKAGRRGSLSPLTLGTQTLTSVSRSTLGA